MQAINSIKRCTSNISIDFISFSAKLLTLIGQRIFASVSFVKLKVKDKKSKKRLFNQNCSLENLKSSLCLCMNALRWYYIIFGIV